MEEDHRCSCGEKKDPKRKVCEGCIRDILEERLDRNRFNARKDEILRAKRRKIKSK